MYEKPRRLDVYILCHSIRPLRYIQIVDKSPASRHESGRIILVKTP